jgi:hypothetical protein
VSRSWLRVCQDAELLKGSCWAHHSYAQSSVLAASWMQVTSKTMCDGNIKERLDAYSMLKTDLVPSMVLEPSMCRPILNMELPGATHAHRRAAMVCKQDSSDEAQP